MKKDIQKLAIPGIQIFAIITQHNGNPALEAYIQNTNAFALQNVLIASKGYGVRDGKHAITAPLRRFFEVLEPNQTEFLETIPEHYLDLFSEFWVSCYLDNQLHDDKYLLLPHMHKSQFVQKKLWEGKEVDYVLAGKKKEQED